MKLLNGVAAKSSGSDPHLPDTQAKLTLLVRRVSPARSIRHNNAARSSPRILRRMTVMTPCFVAARSRKSSRLHVKSMHSVRRAHHDQAGTSLGGRSHLSCNEQVDLSAMVFIAGQPLVNLRSGKVRETIDGHRVNCLAILKQADDVMHANSGACHDGISTPHTRRADNATRGLRSRTHA